MSCIAVEARGRYVKMRLDDIAPGQVLVASPDGAVSHRELFEEATLLRAGATFQRVTRHHELTPPV